MTTAVVGEPKAAAPRSLEELLERHAEVALELSGAGQTAWNGQVVETGNGVFGLADWDGTLHLDREAIIDPLRQMYEHAGEQQPVQTLVRYREAIATLLHEQSHFLGPAGATQEAARGAFTSPGARQLEEGVAEAWAQKNLDDYLNRLGVDKVAPGIKDVRAGGYYPAFVPAVRMLAAELEARAGFRAGEVVDALNRETAEGQWPLIAKLAYDSSRLPDLVPADRAADVRGWLETVLREGFQDLAVYDLLPPDFAADLSRSATGALLKRLHTEITAAEFHHSAHPTSFSLPAAPKPTPTPTTRTRLAPQPIDTALSGVAPPTHAHLATTPGAVGHASRVTPAPPDARRNPNPPHTRTWSRPHADAPHTRSA